MSRQYRKERDVASDARGYAPTCVQEIVDTAGLPNGAFYNHLKAKELLAL
jgi:AcrR family transcriptional regulator